ncbi:hypothetical protein AB0M25_19265, partial [Streptomyces griseomycini]|uniref:hypothetical protein n=1 Tax=Streptomyces griseomycini TaxID=66895 RepID=UPI0034282303
AAWTAIKYTDAVFDEDGQRWVSDAEVAETAYTADPVASAPATCCRTSRKDPSPQGRTRYGS